MDIGRISGKLLVANLLRDGTDLAFETDLLYLDVNNGRIGIKNDAPNFDLEVDTDIHAVDANITSTLYVDNFIISSNQITTASGAIHVYPGGLSPIAYFDRITSDDLVIDYNTIRSIDGENIQLDPNGTGTVELFNTTNVNGDLNVSGNVDVDGDLSTASNIFIGDAVYDVVTVTTRFDTEILPKLNNVYSIGTADFRWNETFFDSADIDSKMFVGSFTLYQNEILTSSQDLIFNITGANPVANLKNINNNDLLIAGNSITNINTNEDIILATSGTGSIELKSTTNIDGGLNIVGNAYIDGDLSKTGNLIVGDTIYDNVTIVPDFSQSLIPGADATYDLGREQGDSTTGRWNDFYIKDISNIDNFTFSVVTISDQVEINGTTRTIQTIQSNDNLVLNPDTGVVNVEELKLESVPGGFIIPPLTIDNPNAFNTSASDSFGSFVDISDSYVLVGAVFEDDAGGTSSGKAYIFNKSTGTLLHTLDNPNAYGTTSGDWFGNKGAITDTYAVISAQNEDQPFGSAGSASGKVYVFNPSTGSLIYTLDNPNPVRTTSFDQFGSGGIALSNRYLTIGTPSEYLGGSSAAGAAYIYDLDNYATTTVSASFEFGNNSTLLTRRGINVTTVPGMSSDDLVTQVTIDSIDIRGALGSPGALDIKFAGAASYDNYTSNVSDATYRNFSWLGGDIYLGQFTSKSFSIDVDPNAFVSFSPSGMPSGYYWQVRVNFTITKLVGVKYLADPNVTGLPNSDLFGTAVGVSDTYTIVGAPREDVGGSESGTVYIYDNASGNLLHTINNPNAYGTEVSDRFGTAVDISDTYAIVGAFDEDDAGGTSSGKAYIFSSVTGALLHTLDNPNPVGTSGGDQFGVSVQINNDFAVVGAQSEDEATASNSGKVYIFDPASGILLQTLDNPNAFGTADGDQFGSRVALHNTDLAVSAIAEDDAGGTTSGKVYVYQSDTESDVITNLNATTPVRLAATDDGYYVFSGTNGIVIPAGDTASRPTSPELGDTRWNNQLNYLECFDGSVYQIATGGGAEVTAELMEDLGYIYTIILG